MLFSTFRLPVSGITLGTNDTDTIIGSVTPALADTTAEFIYVSDITFPTEVMAYNLEIMWNP